MRGDDVDGIYSSGYNDGYNEGYREGVADAMESLRVETEIRIENIRGELLNE